MNDIKGLETWEGETKEWNRMAGKLKTRAGIGIIDALENWYKAWQTKHTDRNRREYMLWRLRLHLKHNSDPEFLKELNDVFDIGLHDEEIGPSYWDIKPEHATGFRTGRNWRTDSGIAIQGGTKNKTLSKEEQEFTNTED
jgi:hypothetical protein